VKIAVFLRKENDNNGKDKQHVALVTQFERLIPCHKNNNNKQDVSLIEWPERLGDKVQLPDNRLEITIDGVGIQAASRLAHVKAVGPRWRKVVEEWARTWKKGRLKRRIAKSRIAIYERLSRERVWNKNEGRVVRTSIENDV
jgi:hypothetical protein